MRVVILIIILTAVFAINYANLAGVEPAQVLDSDLVQPFMITRDLLIDPSSIKSWHLSPAIYMFPDYFVALFINLFGYGPIFTVIASGTVLGVLMAFAGGYLLGSAGWANFVNASMATAFAVTATVLIGHALPGTIATLLQTWTFTLFIHSGALFSGLLLIGLWTNVEFASPSRPRLFAISLLLTAVASYSDLSFLVYFVVPIIVVTTIVWFARKESGRLKRVVLLAGVAIAAYSVDWMTRDYRGLQASFSIRHNVTVWFDLVWPNLREDPLFAIFLFATPLLLIRAAHLTARVLRNREPTAADFIEMTLAGTQCLAIVVPALFDGHDDIKNLRYSLPVALIPVLWVLVLVRSWLSRVMQVGQYAYPAAGIWIVALVASFLPRLGALPALAAKAPIVACMHDLGIEAAYSDYWNAKGPVFQSNYRIHIVHLASNGRRYDFNTNERWLSHSIVDGTPVSINAIVMQRLDVAAVEHIYGSPSRVESCRGLTFWLYDEALPLPPH